MDCIVHGVAKGWTRLINFHFTILGWADTQVNNMEPLPSRLSV